MLSLRWRENPLTNKGAGKSGKTSHLQFEPHNPLDCYNHVCKGLEIVGMSVLGKEKKKIGLVCSYQKVPNLPGVTIYSLQRDAEISHTWTMYCVYSASSSLCSTWDRTLNQTQCAVIIGFS